MCMCAEVTVRGWWNVSLICSSISSFLFFKPIHNITISFETELLFMTAELLAVACLQLDHLTKLHSSCLSVLLSSVKYVILKTNEVCSCELTSISK